MDGRLAATLASALGSPVAGARPLSGGDINDAFEVTLDDGRTLFVSVQHPAEDAETLDKVETLWPDFKDGQPPRPSVVAIRRTDGQPVGA